MVSLYYILQPSGLMGPTKQTNAKMCFAIQVAQKRTGGRSD